MTHDLANAILNRIQHWSHHLSETLALGLASIPHLIPETPRHVLTTNLKLIRIPWPARTHLLALGHRLKVLAFSLKFFEDLPLLC